MLQAPIETAERQAIMDLRGIMSAEAAGKKFGRHASSILKIWKADGDYVPFQPRPPHTMSPRQVILLDVLDKAGHAGMLLSDITLLLQGMGYFATAESHRSSLSHINYKLLGQGKPERITRISKQNEPARYALMAVVVPVVAELDADWTPSIPAVSRRISGDLGLGATPGAIVSVARVTWLDGRL